jgi:hypothetical protein
MMTFRDMKTVAFEQPFSIHVVCLIRVPVVIVALNSISSPAASDPGEQIHRAIMRHLDNSGLLLNPTHPADDLGPRLASGTIGCPANALNCGWFSRGYHQLIVEGQCTFDASIDLDNHPEADAQVADPWSFASAP